MIAEVRVSALVVADRATATPDDDGHGATPPRQPLTYANLGSWEPRSSQMRRLPATMRDSFVLTWQAGRGHLIATTVLQLVSGAAIGVQLLLARQVLLGLDVGGGARSLADAAPELAALVLATIVTGAVAARTTYHQALLSDLVVRHAFDRIIDVTTGVDLATMESPEFRDALQRAHLSGMNRTLQLVGSVVGILSAAIGAGAIALALLAVEPVLVPFAAVAAVPVLIASIHNSRQAHKFEWDLTAESRERLYLVNLFTSTAPGKEMRSFDLAQFLRHRLDVLNITKHEKLREFSRDRFRVAIAGRVAGALASAVALVFLIWLVADGRLDLASAITAGVGLQQLAGRLQSLTTSVSGMLESAIFLHDFSSFLGISHARDAVDAPGAEAPPFAEIRAEGVSFTYPGSNRRALADIDFQIRAGEVVALVGENGSGKTTLAKLLSGLYESDEGRVTWNGVDVRSLDVHALRRRTAVVFQDFVRYLLPVDANIGVGDTTRFQDRVAIEAAAADAGATEFIDALPLGFDTRLGREFEAGHELSIGQWQRLALARAFFRNADLVVLDEPTAALDPRAEFELFERIRALGAGRSVLLISHRFSSVRNADRIYVLDHGAVAETGSHEQLMANGALYAELFTMQANAYLARNGDRTSARRRRRRAPA